ncbi:MAG: transporter suffix domain-containing protein [Betaproteobacteria bacterium]|nr:transporter suffix domain-containing protein [Betaproteobacteria bacterium]
MSILSWCLLVIVPFSSISNSEKAAYSAVLIIFAEITGWLSVAILGKEIFRKFKGLYRYLKAWLMR